MKSFRVFYWLCFLCLAWNVGVAQTANQPPGMNNDRLAELLREASQTTEGVPGNWQALYRGRILVVVTDEANNRMRVFSPVIPEEEIKMGEMRKMLEANFHSALDAKYSLYEGYAISVFTHPLKELTDEQFIDALSQVYHLAENYGTTYSSTLLIFGGGFGEEEQKPEEEEKRINKKPGGKS